MPIHQTFLASNSGEISPYLLYRSDFAKVPAAAEKMRNFLPLPFGSTTKRPGTQWLSETEYGGANSKAFGFTSSDGVNYILHFTQSLLTIYRANGTVADTVPFVAGYLFTSDANEEFSIRGLQMVQVNDVAFFTHPRVHPLQLVSLSDTSWTLGFVPFERAPMLDENSDRTKTYTVASNPVAPTWASGASYAVGVVAFTNCEWLCIAAHTADAAKKPGSGAQWQTYWQRMFYSAGDPITLLGDDRSEVAWEADDGEFESAAAWEIRYKSYQEGDTVLNVDGSMPYPEHPSFFVCVEDHTLDATYWHSTFHNAYRFFDRITWAVVFEWQDTYTSGGYIGGTYYYANNNIYNVKTDHGAYGSGPPLYQPGVTAGWENYWDLIYEGYDQPLAAVIFAPYLLGEKVSYNGLIYQASSEHIPSDANRPGVGSQWILISKQYVTGSRVSYEGLIYVANTTHTPTLGNRPGVGGVWTLLSGGYTSSFAAGPTSPGKYYKIAPQRDDADFQVELAATLGNHGKFTAPIIMQGAWNFFTFGTWSGTFNVQRSINGGKSWEVVRSYQSTADRNVSDKGTEDEPTLLRIQYFHVATGTGNPRALLVPESASVTGFALMDTYVGVAAMTGVAKTALMSGNTYQWSEGAFDLERGFPRALTLHGFRLWFAGTLLNPVSIWASRIDDFFDFETGTLDDDGIFRTLADSHHHPIRWLASSRRLFLGTPVGEWVEGSESVDTPISPTNIQFREYTPTGSCPHQPLKVNDGLFFLGRQGGRLYELGASDSGNDTYAAGDLSRLAEHLTVQGISNFAFQQTREPCLWCVTRAGNLLSFNYSRSENIAAWAMHRTQGGSFRDVIVFASDDGDDQVFFIIDRAGTSNLERFPQGWQATQEAGTVGNYVDAAGRVGGDLPIVSELRLPPQDLQLDGGGTQGRKKRANEILLNVYQSFGGGVQYDGQNVLFDWSNSSDRMDSPNLLKTQWIGVTLPSAHMDDLSFSIIHSEPYPFTVRAAVLRWNLHEP
jgi:hypothetical protein